MEIRFKFRSSPVFDSIDIGEQSSISIRDLKSRIVSKKHLNLCQDFDLVFSEFISGLEYTDENTQIPSGSSVIIKRVPAKSSPLLRETDVSAGCFAGRNASDVNIFQPPVVDAGVNESDDFGVDLCPPSNANLADHVKLASNSDANVLTVRRCSGELPATCQKLGVTIFSPSTPKDSSLQEGSTLVMHSELKLENLTKLDRTSGEKHISTENSDMPSELKCSLCRTLFKEAVMIPCCQRSFCDKCIRLALAENPKCPTCSSRKCRPEDLLSNVSLRQAIERFLEPQLLRNGSENELDRYEPDGESGIQARDLSYAVPVRQRDMRLNQSASRKIPNQLLPKKIHDHAGLDMQGKPGALKDLTEFQGENEPQNMAGANEEANSCIKNKEVFRAFTRGVERNFTAPGRLNRGLRTCYMCGSPDHLIRDCPSAATSRTSHWSGDASFPGVLPSYTPPSYWPGSPPPMRPMMNMYGGPGMMFCNANMAPATPFAFNSYAPSMYGGYPITSGYLNQGGVQPPSVMNAQQMCHTDLLELQGCAKLQRNSNGNLWREQPLYQDHNVNRLDHTERGATHSGDGFPRRSEENHRSHDHSDDDDEYLNNKRRETVSRPLESGREYRHAHSDRSASEKDMHDSRSRHDSRRNDETRGHDSDSKLKHHYSKKDYNERRTEHDETRSDRDLYSHSGSGLGLRCSSGDARQRGNESGHRSRHSGRSAKANGKERHHAREKISRYSDDDYAEDHQSHKRKRFH